MRAKILPMMIERDTDAVIMVRAMVSARKPWSVHDYDDRVPVFSRKMLAVAKEVLGILPMVDRDGTRSWRLAVDWPRRLREAGIDPETLELVDLAKWQIFVKAMDQRREMELQERARRDVREGLREATAKYRPPAAPRPSELIRNHVMTGRIVRELRKESDRT